MFSRDRFEDDKLDELAARCRAGGVPLTNQRRVVLQDLAGRRDHPTADQLFETVTARYPGISRTTVYRVLETLVQLGIARKISIPEAVARFDADIRRHHHLVCSVCHGVADFTSEELERLALPPEIGEGFMVSDYSLTVTGLCRRCRSAASPGAT